MRSRWTEALGIALIGDGVVGAAIPTRHVARWSTGPAPWRRAMRRFADRPGLTRVLAVGEFVAGLWLALRRG